MRLLFGIDFKHTVEFSSFGCVPRSDLGDLRLGQLDQLYLASSGLSTWRLGPSRPCEVVFDGVPRTVLLDCLGLPILLPRLAPVKLTGSP